jgi:alkanesulfonate monooxygenase
VPVEIIGMVGTRDASEIKGPLVDGPVVDWMDGPVVDPDYLTAIAQAHDDGGFDRVLIGYGGVAPEGFAIAGSVLSCTRDLGVLIAHRPGFVAPSVLARQAATLDQLSGGGRVALHFITGGDEADQRREGDFVPKGDRYRRTGELMSLLRRIWSEDTPFDHDGEFYRCESAFSSVKPVTPDGIPMYFAGASGPAIDVGARYADVYAFWGEPLDGIRQRISEVQAAAQAAGRTVDRFSVSLRPIAADTEEEAWERANEILERTQERAAEYVGLQNTAGSEGSQRLLRYAGQKDLHDKRLWTALSKATGAAGNSTALVGSYEQVAESLLDYVAVGASTLLIRGYDPVGDAAAYANLVRLVHEKVGDDVLGFRAAAAV